MRNLQRVDVNKYAMTIFCIFLIFSANILFNGWICEGNRVFYLDDLGCVRSFLNNTTLNSKYIFSTGANKIRPVLNVAMWISLKLSGHNYELIDEILMLLNFINAVLVYAFTYMIQCKGEMAYRAISSCICAMMFIASRFAYYNISELLGIMESLGIAFSLSMLMLLYLYMEESRRSYYYIAFILYTLLIWTHERYFVLFFLFPLVLLFQKNISLPKKCKRSVLPIISLASFWIIRTRLFGSRAIDGTGGTSISDTFDIKTAISYCFSQVGYILGFNCGPQYLNGIEHGQVPGKIKLLLTINLIIVIGIITVYLKILIQNAIFRKENLKKIILFISFIGLCIICSSTTIRVEMRWIYVSYAAYLILLFYMIYGILEYYPLDIKKVTVFSIYAILVFTTEWFYRDHYDNIYYWTHKDMSRELYNVTVEKYGEELGERDIVIVGDFWKNDGWQTDNWKAFFSPYIDSDGVNIVYAGDLYEADRYLREYTDSIVLLEDKQNKRYTDITKKMGFTGVRYLYGIYEDNWCEVDCAFEIRGNVSSKASITFYYPEDIKIIGEPNGIIIVNDEKQFNFDITGNLVTVEFEIVPQSTNIVQIISNYWVHENTGRSEDGRLSSVIAVSADF